MTLNENSSRSGEKTHFSSIALIVENSMTKICEQWYGKLGGELNRVRDGNRDYSSSSINDDLWSDAPDAHVCAVANAISLVLFRSIRLCVLS